MEVDVDFLADAIEEMARDLIAPIESQSPMGMADYYATQVAPHLRAMGFDVPRFDDDRFYDHEAPPQGCVTYASMILGIVRDWLTINGEQSAVHRSKNQPKNRFYFTDAEGEEYEVVVRPKGKR